MKVPNNSDIEKDINKWVSMEEKLENADQMIDFQTEYTKELHTLSDYPKIDFELIRKTFKEWEHHKVENIMTYRNKSFASPVTGSARSKTSYRLGNCNGRFFKNFFRSTKKIRVIIFNFV